MLKSGIIKLNTIAKQSGKIGISGSQDEEGHDCGINSEVALIVGSRHHII